MPIYISSKLHKELNYWKDKFQNCKKQLDELIPETLLNRKKIKELERELKESINEKNSIKNTLFTTEKQLQDLLKEKEITKGQKMTLLFFAGTLDAINKLNILQGNKIKLIAQLIGANEKNIEKDFNGRGLHTDSPLSNKPNYTFMEKICIEYDIIEWLEPVQSILDKIKDK